MKLGRVGPDEIFHRFLTPKWAYLPTSGAGAAIRGGRFNRPGVEALYLSRAPRTALEEYRQGASIVPPATLSAYRVTIREVVDLSGGYDPALWAADWAARGNGSRVSRPPGPDDDTSSPSHLGRGNGDAEFTQSTGWRGQ